MEHLLVTVVLGLAAAAVLLLLLQQWSSSRPAGRLRLPPGPRPLPVLGNLLMVAASKCRHRDLYKLAETYGPIMWLRLGTVGTVVVQSPELAMEVLKHQDTTFASRPPPSYTVALLTNNVKDVAFAPYGSYWRLARKVMTVELLTHKRITDFQHVRVEELGRLVDAIGGHLGRPVNLGYLLRAFNLNNIVRMGMSKTVYSSYKVEDPQQGTASGSRPSSSPAAGKPVEDDHEEVELCHLIRDMVDMGGMQGIGDAIPWLSFLDTWFNILPKAKLEQTKRQLDAFYSSAIQEHRQHRAANPGCQPRDFVDVLLSVSLSSDGQGLSDEMITSQLIDMVAAGTDTSSVTTEWAMAELLRQPALLEQAAREVEQVVGRAPGRVVAESDIPDLPFLQAVVKETLRMHPPVPFLVPHYSTQDATVGGYHIPATTMLLVNTWGLGRDPASWKHPHRFRPHRFFLHDAIPDGSSLRSEADLRGHHFHLLPFGSGKRICPGMGLGLAMVHLTLATLLHSFTWSLPADVKQPEDLDMSESQGIVVRRALSLKAVPHDPKLPVGNLCS